MKQTTQRRASRRGGDRGIALVLTALVLVVLLILSAFAIDLGAVYNERRQDQSAADTGALAAAAELTNDESDIVDAAKDYAEDTLGHSLTGAQWNSCGTDSGALSTVAAGANCITYTDRQVRVRIPDQFYRTSFGKVAGVDNVRHGAFAIAGLAPAGFGGVLPFGVTGISSDGGYSCLKSDSNGAASPECGSVTGDFGFLDFTEYTARGGNTGESCGNGQFNERVRRNIALGVDHDLSRQGTEHLTLVSDPDACSATPNTKEPDSTISQTGNNSSDITDGLFSATTTFDGGLNSRLRQSSPLLFAGAGSQTTVRGVTLLDDNPLWKFIPPNYGPGEAATADIPVSCKRNQFVDSSNNYTTANLTGGTKSLIEAIPSQRDRVLALLTRCIRHYRGQTWNGQPINANLSTPEATTGCSGPCSDPVFALNSDDEDPDLFDIQYTPRFGYVPQIPNFDPPNNTKRAFVAFRPIFIQRVTLNAPTANVIWDPGFAPTPNNAGGYQSVRETAAFVFPPGMLPGDLSSPDAPNQVGANRFVSLIR
jgi:Tfp pilus assembly protein PilX